MSRIVLPGFYRAASFRLAALYVAVFAGSALVLGIAVFFEARSALQQQMTARIETDAEFLLVESQTEGLDHLIEGRADTWPGAQKSALDYLIEDRGAGAGTHLAGEMPAAPGLEARLDNHRRTQASRGGWRPTRKGPRPGFRPRRGRAACCRR